MSVIFLVFLKSGELNLRFLNYKLPYWLLWRCNTFTSILAFL